MASVPTTKKFNTSMFDDEDEIEKNTTVPSSSSSKGKSFDELTVVDIRLEDMVGEWAKVLEFVYMHCKDASHFQFSGGLSPIDRRKKLMRVTFGVLKTFVGTTEWRGHKLVNYATKNDDSAIKIAECCKAMQIKGPKSNLLGYSKGPNSVVSIKVAFSDVFISFRLAAGPAKFGEKIFKGDLPPMYQWIGSLASIYIVDEESKKPEDMALIKIQLYEEFQDWYIQVRREAAQQNNPKKDEKNIAKVKLERNKSRLYYNQTLGSFHIDTRRAWAEKKFDKPVLAGVKPFTDEGMDKFFVKSKLMTPDDLAAAKASNANGERSNANK